MPLFSSLPPEIRHQILTYALQPTSRTPIPPLSSIKLSVNNATALTLATVSKQWQQDIALVHANWRKGHPLEDVLKEEWTREAEEQMKSVEGIMRRWGDWHGRETRRHRRRVPRHLDWGGGTGGLIDGGHEDEAGGEGSSSMSEYRAPREPEGMRLVRVLEWCKGYMTHLRARGFEQKQRNRELERTIEVQRRWLREARDREEELLFRIKMMEEGMDRGLDVV